ncbi:MAG: helix-turn-helix domain-containing protein [Acidobacteria bacterium]|nr:helix-turn-helix domain-containing protein [Acidobacteriota bacterium]
MGSFGKNLATEREARGISLEDISEYTKIGVRMLKAIEAERFDLLPGGIFNKSYVRQYARYLGLNEEQVTSEYLQAVVSVPEAPILQRPS